ncbi:MAG: branched-chain amino acid ABC transporter permease [Acidimicrobiales bacterium]
MTTTEPRPDPATADLAAARDQHYGPPGTGGPDFQPNVVQRFAPFALAVVTPFALEMIPGDNPGNWKAFIGLAALVVIGLMAWKWTPRGRLTHRQEMRKWRTPDQRMLAALTIFFVLAAPFILASDFSPPMNFPWATWFAVLNLVLIFAMGAAAFNLLVGYTGQISLAHVAFLVLGTIIGAQVGIIFDLTIWVALPTSAAAGALVGVIVGLPALRLRGLYLLLATLGVHFVMLLIYREYLQSRFGFVGISFPKPNIPSALHWIPGVNPDDNGEFIITGQFRWYWVIMPISVGTLLLMSNLVRTREGRAFAAVRERDISASLLGINVARSKLLAFAVSSAVVTMSGALGSYYLGARGEDSFDIQLVLDYAIIIVVGGFSSIQGAVFGSFFFWVLPEWFKWAREELWVVKEIGFLSDYPSEIDLAIKGFLVVLVLVFKPEGLTGVWRSTKSGITKLYRRTARSGS